jgi:uncharacterized protein (TIGR03083 family)
MTDGPDTDPRELFATAAESFAGLVARIPDGAWSRNGLGEWTVRELVGHTLRAVLTAVAYLETPAEVATMASPSEYYSVVRSTAGLHEAVAARGRKSGEELGEDPAATVRQAVQDGVRRVRAADLDRVVSVSGGSMRYGSYLPTRVVELVVHSDDLARATGVDHEPPAVAVRACLDAIVGTLDGVQAMAVVRALLGRGSLATDVLSG